MERPDIEEVYRRQIKNIYRTALVLLGNREDAEDVASEVFMKYLKKPRAFSDETHERNWFIAVTRNCCKDLWRTVWRRKTVLGDIPEMAICPEEDRAVIEEVMSLPYKLREVVYLHYYEGYTLREIAKITHTSESTLQSRVAKAREILKDLLSE